MATILQIPGSLSLAGNIQDIILSSVATVNFKIIDGAITILEENYDPDAAGLIHIRLRDLMPTLLHLNIPSANVFEQVDGAKSFNFVIDGSSTTHKIVAGGVNAAIDPLTFLKANWLTWQQQQKRVKYMDPEWLTYYATVAATVKLKAYFKENDPETIDLTSLASGKLYSLNVNFQYLSGLFATAQPVYFDIWTEDATPVRLSFIQRYVLFNDQFNFDDLFIAQNTVGGLDTFRFTGTKDEDNQFDIASSLFDEDTTDYEINFDQVFTKNTGYFESDRYRAWLNDFFNSTRRWYLTGDGLQVITISNPETKVSLDDPGSFSYEFKFALSRQTKYLNFERAVTLPENVEIIDPDAEVFFLAPRLIEFPSAVLDRSLLFPVQSPFVQEWKQLTYGAMYDSILLAVAEMGFITAGEVSGYLEHVERKQLTGIEVRAISVTFSKPFSLPPIQTHLRVYRWEDLTKNGYWQMQDVEWHYPDANAITSTGFNIVIEDSEDMLGVIVEYEFKASIV